MKKICLDPGHGGHDSGAVGPSGLRECDVVLDICEKMAPALRQSGWAVFFTRDHDVFVGLDERCDIANAFEVDLFISVHANAFEDHYAHGFEVWTSPGDTPADPIASNIYQSALNTFPFVTGRPDLGDGDEDKEARFRVLVGTRMPAVLVETAFISNFMEEDWLKDPGFRLRMAGAIVTGVGHG